MALFQRNPGWWNIIVWPDCVWRNLHFFILFATTNGRLTWTNKCPDEMTKTQVASLKTPRVRDPENRPWPRKNKDLLPTIHDLLNFRGVWPLGLLNVCFQLSAVYFFNPNESILTKIGKLLLRWFLVPSPKRVRNGRKPFVKTIDLVFFMSTLLKSNRIQET